MTRPNDDNVHPPPPEDAEPGGSSDDQSSDAGSTPGFESLFSPTDDSGYGPGDDVGPYRLIERLGKGAFGVVFRAQRREPPVKEVAIKLIHPGLDSAGIVKRFKTEQQVLAMMNHPGIAHAIDAGTTRQGRPYLVMEYVRGENLTDYCRNQNLDLRTRLLLFIEACRAVQHAHDRGVIHRDLKPANILVREVDGRPTPVVIDFGVAKVMMPVAGVERDPTLIESVIGTHAYMSPEQAGLRPMDIDVRADVFSLGVILFELITGVVPLWSAEFVTDPFGEGKLLVRTARRPRPSTRLAQLTPADRDKVQAVSAAFALTLEELRNRLRTELDWIPHKALQLDRADRYDRPGDLAADVENYLANRPLRAGPPKLTYRARKFVRRNRSVVLAAAAVSIAIASGVSVAAWNWRLAVVERRATDDLLWFINSAVASAAGGEGSGRRLPLNPAAIGSAARAARQTFGQKGPVLDRLNCTFANAYLAAGQIQPALDLFETVDLSRMRGRDLALAASVKGHALFRQRRPHEAVQILRDAIDRLESEGGGSLSLPERAALQEQYAGALKFAQDRAGAREAYGRAIDLQKQMEIPDPVKLRELQYDILLVDVRELQALDYPRAHTRALEACGYSAIRLRMNELRRQVDLANRSDRRHSNKGEQFHSLSIEAAALGWRADRDRASIDMFADVVWSARDELGPQHFRVVEAHARLGKMLLDDGRIDRAIDVLTQALTRYRGQDGYGPTSPDTMTVSIYLADALLRDRRVADARAVLEDVFADAEANAASAHDLSDRGQIVVDLFTCHNQFTAAAEWRELVKRWGLAAAPKEADKPASL